MKMQIPEDNDAENIENMDRFGGNNKFETPAAFIDEMSRIWCIVFEGLKYMWDK